MNDETPINGEKRSARRARLRRRLALQPRLPEPVERAWFAVQERVIWPLQDRLALLGPGRRRAVLGGGAAAFIVVVAVAVLVLSSGGGSSAPTTTVSEVTSPREPLVAPTPAPQAEPKEKQSPRETLHGAAPVFSPPSPASKRGEKTGKSNSQAAEPQASEEEAPAETASAGEPTSSSPGSARISSDPKSSDGGKTAEGATDSAATAAARATVPDGPPAGPAALKVAREFAKGFVVYETGGEASVFRDAFTASATPELTKALLQRPPKQPAGVKVPRAKVLNVVAGPSQGTVYKVSVSLLRVGVTSELRLDMEKVKTAGKPGKGAEWRVTNVLG